jgi:hypothetical protein
VLLIGWLGLLAGCGLSLPQFTHPPAKVQPAIADSEATHALLQWLEELRTATPAGQAERVFAARSAFETQGTPSLHLRYALALAMSGVVDADPVAARKHLAALVARPEWLLPGEYSLAQWVLREVDAHLVLLAETQRLQQEGTVRERDRSTALGRRLVQEMEENNRLHRALDDAQQKLEAIMQLERSTAPTVPTPRVTRKPSSP